MIFADTHVLVWLMSGDRRLPSDARSTLLAEPRLVVSAVTAWEYADLQRRGRLGSALPLYQLVQGLNLRIEPLPAESWQMIDRLPDVHHDPVDRMLVAHAHIADATLATADDKMRRYPVKLLW